MNEGKTQGKSTLTVQLPDSLHEFLEAEARRRLSSKSAVAREILVEYIRGKQTAQPAAMAEPVVS